MQFLIILMPCPEPEQFSSFVPKCFIKEKIIIITYLLTKLNQFFFLRQSLQNFHYERQVVVTSANVFNLVQ